MIRRAGEQAGKQLSFSVADLRDWHPLEPVDVLVSNATLQWVPRHRELFASWVEGLAQPGWLAFQVPGNFGEPSHRLLHDLAADRRFSAATAGVEAPAAFDAVTYLADLSALGCAVEAWETTYLHVLSGPDPVFRWISGTGARPILQALPEELRAEFVAEYQALLREAYPVSELGTANSPSTVLPYRRVFCRGAARSPTLTWSPSCETIAFVREDVARVHGVV